MIELSSWLRDEAWRLPGPNEFVLELCRRVRQAGVPLTRLNCHIRYLDPEIIGVSYFWTWRDDRVAVLPIPPDMRERPQFLDSPMAPILLGQEQAISVDLEAAPVAGEWPLLAEFRAAGLTGYLIVAVPFSDGTISSLAWATDRPGGFANAHVATINSLLPAIARILELHALRRLSTILLDAYVGNRSGSRILGGQIRLGDVEAIDAVLWFSDLRGSTGLASSLDPDEYITALNRYFAATAGSVLSAGGEVLKFIGDAVMAAFPIDGGQSAPAVAAAALDAAKSALGDVAAIPPVRGRTLACGIGLHRGTVMFGNVGVRQRLDFTVTGTAASIVTRIEGLCRDSGHPILASPEIATLLPNEFVSIGRHELRGITGETQIFRPASSGASGSISTR